MFGVVAEPRPEDWYPCWDEWCEASHNHLPSWLRRFSSMTQQMSCMSRGLADMVAAEDLGDLKASQGSRSPSN